jgi:NAD(P)-dependent dehydrogenase (short-subunit alcohol dehydrogenase family)
MNAQGRRAALVTGGSAGIGGQLTVSLARAGYEVFFVGRNASRGRSLQSRIAAGGDRAHFIQADLGSQYGTARCAGEVRAALAARGHRGLDALVANLGGVFASPQSTDDGVEATMASNFVHPLLLACLLVDQLEAARGRVVQMSSSYRYLVRVTPRDFEGQRWDCGMNMYGRAKTVALRAGDELGRRWKARGVRWTFADPGMAETPLTRSMGPETFPRYGRFLFPSIRQLQRNVPLTWCVSGALRLVAGSKASYAGPGFSLPRALVGFSRKKGARYLEWALSRLRPEYRAVVEKALALPVSSPK